MSKIIAVCNQKGGVGKTFTSRALSTQLATKGYKVLAVDGDQQADLSRQFGIDVSQEGMFLLTHLLQAEIETATNLDGEIYEYDTHDAIVQTEDGVDVLPSSIAIAGLEPKMVNASGREYLIQNILEQVYDEYDFIIIDCPPNLGQITLNMLTVADEVLIPANPDEQSTIAIMNLINTMRSVRRKLNPDLKENGILFTMADIRTNDAKNTMETVRELCSKHIKIYDTFIPYSVRAREAAGEHISIFDYEKTGKIALAYKDFTDEFLQTIQEETEGE